MTSVIIGFMDKIREKKFAAGLSIISNTIVILLKVFAGIVSGSISIISEAIHSMSDLLASFLAFFAVTRSAEPADKDHPYGHGKYEDMAGFIEGVLIILAAFFIVFESIKKITIGGTHEIETTLGISVMAFAIAANYLVSKYLFHVAEKTDSVALHADGEHLRTDIWTSLGVLAGLVLIKVTGIMILDPIIAIIVASMIFKTGFSISKNTLNNLLDSSLPQEDINVINKIIEDYECGYPINYKNLKSRRSGPFRDIEITILCPGEMTVKECHRICDELEVLIKEKFENVSIVIHIEPAEL